MRKFLWKYKRKYRKLLKEKNWLIEKTIDKIKKREYNTNEYRSYQDEDHKSGFYAKYWIWYITEICDDDGSQFSIGLIED